MINQSLSHSIHNTNFPFRMNNPVSLRGIESDVSIATRSTTIRVIQDK